MDYKEVFQLAEDKGFEDFDLIAEYTKEKGEPLKLSEIKIISWIEKNELLALTLIQKWLRDTHGLIIWVKPELSEGFEWGLFNRSKTIDIYKVATDGYCDTYEECLLIGVSEALQLI